MGEGGADAAAVEVDDASAVAAGEDNTLAESIVALWSDEAESLQEIERIALNGEMATQISARGVADAQFFDQGGIMHSALLKIAQCLRVPRQLLLIESCGFLQHIGRVGGSDLSLEESEALAEGEMPG